MRSFVYILGPTDETISLFVDVSVYVCVCACVTIKSACFAFTRYACQRKRLRERERERERDVWGRSKRGSICMCYLVRGKAVISLFNRDLDTGWERYSTLAIG
jgi:hypothetical protein